MTVLSASRCSFVVCAASLILPGCNALLDINEPEEIRSPPVTYFPWDGNNGDSAVDLQIDALDASGDASGDLAVDEPTIPADSAPDVRRDGTTPIVDARGDGPLCVLHVPDGGMVCGQGCTMLCPLHATCRGNADCTSGRCYAGRCTLPTCLNDVRDGDETDVDCGGACPVCGPGQRCRAPSDCAGGLCTAGICQSMQRDASTEGTPLPDASTLPDAPSSMDAADAGPAARDALTDHDGEPDETSTRDALIADADAID